MDRERAYLVATPFKKRGKKSLKVSDFVFTLSLDMKWGPPEKVRALLLEAEKEGMVRLDGDMVHASFEDDAVKIPIGFKPKAEEGFFERVVRLIISKTNLSQKEVIAMVNERQDSLRGLVETDVVVLLVARELGIDVRDLAAQAYQDLIGDTEMDEEKAAGA